MKCVDDWVHVGEKGWRGGEDGVRAGVRGRTMYCECISCPCFHKSSRIAMLLLPTRESDASAAGCTTESDADTDGAAAGAAACDRMGIEASGDCICSSHD